MFFTAILWKKINGKNEFKFKKINGISIFEIHSSKAGLESLYQVS